MQNNFRALLHTGLSNISGFICDVPVPMQVCSSIDRLPGITSATHSLTVTARDSASERLVCGFQVTFLPTAGMCSTGPPFPPSA